MTIGFEPKNVRELNGIYEIFKDPSPGTHTPRYDT